jgi:hypothetical protein
MTNWFDRIAKFAVIGEKLALLDDNISKVQTKLEDHEKRLVRVETIIEIARPDGSTLRILPGASSS